ncbi:LamG domain-containing protein [Saccharolobus sp.]|uniref:LamG domain-containing protein n=1 Tax=Saccharolobus sp. TaxID=2100761 RepID=UPI0031754A78
MIPVSKENRSVNLGRRKFLSLTSSVVLFSTPAVLLITAKDKKEIAKAQTSLSPTYPYIAIVEGDPSNGYNVITDSGVIFNGSCADGSGTCGIYEAIQYLQNNYGQGEVVLLGKFYPIKSPITSQPNNIEITGSGMVYINPGSAPKILSKRRSFSLLPYVLFTGTTQSLLFANGNQALGTSSQFTISAWIFGKPSGYTGYILSYGSLDDGEAWGIRASSNDIIFEGTTGSIAAPFPSNVPFHLVITYNNGQASIYINGNQVASGSISVSYPNHAYLWINNFPIRSQQGGLNVGSWYSIIENIQFYSIVLSSSQILTLSSSVAQDPVTTPTFWSLYRYLMYLGDLITGIGFQRMGALFYGGVA